MLDNTILNKMGKASGTYERQKWYTQGFGGKTWRKENAWKI